MYSWLLIFHRFRPGQLRNQHGKERSQFFCGKSHFRTLARCLDSRVLMHEHHYMLVQVHIKHDMIYFDHSLNTNIKLAIIEDISECLRSSSHRMYDWRGYNEWLQSSQPTSICGFMREVVFTYCLSIYVFRAYVRLKYTDAITCSKS